MVGLVIVSHSGKIAEGIRELALQVADTTGQIIAAGGMEDGTIGTDAVRIADAIRAADGGDGVAVLADIGSSIMSAEMAIELLEGEHIDVRIADAPVVEGAVAAAVEANCGSSLADVIRAAEETRDFRKLYKRLSNKRAGERDHEKADQFCRQYRN